MPRYVSLTRSMSWAREFESRGRDLVGGLLTNLTLVYDSMATTAHWLRAGSVIPVESLNTQGGGMVLSTGAGAGANSDLYLSSPAGAARTSIVTRPSTVAWYMAWRASYDTAIDAGATMTGGLQDAALGTVGEQLGVTGSVSTAKFCATSGANSALSTVSYATGVYDFEFWGVGTATLQFRVSGESPVALTYGNGAVDGWAPKYNTTNGGGGGARTWRLLDVLTLTSGL
jgi:hypothetical protein